MKKKITALLLSLIMLLSLLPVSAMAIGGTEITVGSVQGVAGESVQVPVTIKNADPICAMGLEFTLSDGLTLTNIEQGPALSSDLTFTAAVNNRKVNVEEPKSGNFTCEDGIIMNLTVSISSAASGELSIEAKPIDGDTGNISNADLEDVTVTFVPGTITVKSSTADRTVKFMNGMTEVATETIANGEKLTNIPAAPTASGSQSFLGWYAVSVSDCLLDNVEETITGTEASTQTAITADTTYHAIWASNAMIAAGYKTVDGKTEISGVSQATSLQTLVTNCNGGTVKLLRNVDWERRFQRSPW